MNHITCLCLSDLVTDSNMFQYDFNFDQNFIFPMPIRLPPSHLPSCCFNSVRRISSRASLASRATSSEPTTDVEEVATQTLKRLFCSCFFFKQKNIKQLKTKKTSLLFGSVWFLVICIGHERCDEINTLKKHAMIVVYLFWHGLSVFLARESWLKNNFALIVTIPRMVMPSKFWVICRELDFPHPEVSHENDRIEAEGILAIQQRSGFLLFKCHFHRHPNRMLLPKTIK